MASRALVASLLLSLLLLSYAADAFEQSSAHGRALTMKKKPKGKPSNKGKDKGLTPKEKEAKAEAKREAEALAQFERRKEKQAKEKAAVLKSARKEAMTELERFNKAEDEKARIQVFVNLWKNAKGPTIRILLTTLVESSIEFAPVYIEICAASMLDADRKGFSFQVADALWAAIVLVDNDGDGDVLLDTVLFNVRAKNSGKKGSGCTYVKNLFTDAEVLAIENGYDIEFASAIDGEAYLPLTECFYAKCSTKESLICCGDEKIVTSGRCGCDKKEPDMCKFNLFFNTPRPIWRCTGTSCPAEKCLCPAIKSKKGKKKASGGKGKGKSKPKGKRKSKKGKKA